MFTRRESPINERSPAPTGELGSRNSPVAESLAKGALFLSGESVSEPVDEKIEYGSERLQELTAGIFAAKHPARGTFFTVPSTLEKTTFAHAALPQDITEGAPAEKWSMELPVDIFVDAPDFQDWENGRVDSKNGISSKRTIRQYTRKPQETAAPIQHAIVYIQPDGTVFASLVGDGAHRLAAAMKRGDSSIRVYGDVSFARLAENFLPSTTN